MSCGDPFIDELQWQGTNDPASYLSIPAAIEFQAKHDWDSVRARCQTMLLWVKDELEKLPNVRPWYPTNGDMQKQMAAVIVKGQNGVDFKEFLYNQHKIEIPVWTYAEGCVMRVSVQGYTTQQELETLLGVIKSLA